MDVPGVVAEALGEEEVTAHVSLGGAGVDALYVTPTRTVVYEGEGLLSDESVTEIPHNAEQVAVSEGRRKATIRLSYGLENDREVVVPARQVDEALGHVLAGVLAATGVIGSDEEVRRTYRFSELTLVVTSDRLVKHVGNAVWDAEESEEILFADVRDIGLEEGSVSTQLVLETAERQERIKTPADSARQVHADVEDALLSFHGVPSYEQFRDAVASESDAPDSDDSETADSGADADTTDGFARSGLDPISTAGAGDTAPEDTAGVEEADATVEGGDATAESGDATTETDTGTATADAAGTAGGAAGDGEEGNADADGTDAGGTGAAAEGRETAEGEGFAGSPFEPAASRQSPDPEVVEAELRALEEALARQADLVEEQRAAVEALVEELGLD